MKTLDEVIEELEDEGLFADALHYLKEYRNCGNCAYADGYLRCTQDSHNDPLDWDELKTMEGKPVWVEGSAFAYGFWAIPYCFENSGGNEYVFMWGDQYWKEEMRDADDGISWQAYRKERS